MVSVYMYIYMYLVSQATAVRWYYYMLLKASGRRTHCESWRDFNSLLWITLNYFGGVRYDILSINAGTKTRGVFIILFSNSGGCWLIQLFYEERKAKNNNQDLILRQKRVK